MRIKLRLKPTDRQALLANGRQNLAPERFFRRLGYRGCEAAKLVFTGNGPADLKREQA
jgi:hypothetical protein